MKNLIVALLISLSFIGCKDKEKTENTMNETNMDDSAMETQENTVDNLELGCYIYKVKDDIVKMEVTKIEGDAVSAKLFYAYAEKDKNEGTFFGNLHGDKLMGTYKFMSEGKESTRDVAFKVEKGQIVEGFGDLEETGTKFRDTTNISYNSTTPWKKADCNQF